MADLADADLYGDLYGNDETDLNETKEEEPTAADAKTKDAPVPDTTAKTTTSAPSATTQSPIASYAPPTQQIQTYEEATDQYRDKPARTETSYSQMAAPERSVRPSEMKDEG
ncbi:hypothetical protein K523DRAFT_357681 [Schizophyllum commune Tattone D]|nr:hypothetical protein K525DRAFT_276777 [Schizophyllum commune Loenen D]KAI5823386.1 hypothetical protein K523DRAFT_357681 [Schizophyllum commune Tattone D]